MGQSFGYMTTFMTLLLGPEYGQFWTSCKFNNVLLIGIKSYIQFLLYKHNPWQHDHNWIVSVKIIFFRMVKSLQSMQAKTYTKGDLCRGLLSNLIFLGTPLTLRKSLLPSWLVSYHKKSISISGLIYWTKCKRCLNASLFIGHKFQKQNFYYPILEFCLNSTIQVITWIRSTQ